MPLPDLDQLDAAALKALVTAYRTEIEAGEAEMERQRLELAAELDQLRRTSSDEIAHLKVVIEKLQHMMFGRKSEKIAVQIEQFELRLEELESAHAGMEAVPDSVPATEPKARPTRRPLPEHLPRESVTHLPADDRCPDCGGPLSKFGEDVSEQLEYIPESFKVIRHVRAKFACGSCDRVVEAPAPSRPIERGLAGPGLLAHMLISKYGDHLPLYRQSEIYARQGVEIEHSTPAGWVGAASELLTPLVGANQKHVLSGSKLHADDTPIPILAPGNGKTRTGRLWTYVRDDRPAGEAFGRSQGRASEEALGELPGRTAGRRLCGLSSSLRGWRHS